jgi:hypothetical protein
MQYKSAVLYFVVTLERAMYVQVRHREAALSRHWITTLLDALAAAATAAAAAAAACSGQCPITSGT